MVANVGLEVTEKKSKEHGKERRQNEERRKLMARSGEGSPADEIGLNPFLGMPVCA